MEVSYNWGTRSMFIGFSINHPFYPHGYGNPNVLRKHIEHHIFPVFFWNFEVGNGKTNVVCHDLERLVL